MSLTGNIRINALFTNTKDNVDLSTPSESVGQYVTKSITTGVLYHDTVSLSASEVKVLNFGDDSLSDVYGNTIALTGLTSLYVKAGSTNAVDITLSGGANAFLNDQPPLGASEGIGFATNIDVSSNSKLYLINGLSATTIDVIVTGDE